MFGELLADEGVLVLQDTLKLRPRNPFGLDDGQFRMTQRIAHELTDGPANLDSLKVVATHLGSGLLAITSNI